MPTVPNGRVGKIEFFEAHLQAWATNAADIGLDPAAVVAFQNTVSTARAGYLAAETAREASKAATLTYHDNTDDMTTAGSSILRTIRNFAETSDDPAVYALAQIPPRATPGPVPSPGRPFNLVVGLAATGALVLNWKSDNPSGSTGTVYEIQRRIGSGSFKYVAVAGERSFTDDTLPAGSSNIVYQITGVRSTTRGQSAQFLVNFGVGGASAAAINRDSSEYRLAS